MCALRLSAEDTTVWCVQPRDASLLLGGVVLCEGAPLRDGSGAVRVAALRRHVETRLGAFPRLRMTLRSLPLGQGLVWVDDEHFDIDRHVRLASVPSPGTEAALRVLVADLLEAPLPPHRPPWELWVVDGLSGGRLALVLRVSHVLGDGLAVLGLMTALLDTEPGASDDDPATWAASPAPGWLSLLGGALADRGRHAAWAARGVGRGMVDPARSLARGVRLVAAAASLLRVAPGLPFTTAVGPRRRFAWVRLPLPGLLAVRRVQDVTLNDVALAVVAAGLGQYVARQGATAERVRAVVPVSRRVPDPAAPAGNRFSLMFVDLPVGGSPLERLRSVHAETAARKRSLQTTISTAVLELGGVVPQPLLRRLGPALLQHQPVADVVVTNVAGPSGPLYLRGARVLEMYPYVTVTANLGLTLAVTSYDDALAVGIVADADSVPDVEPLARAIAGAADELVRTALAPRTHPLVART